jgi:hypothetical protein
MLIASPPLCKTLSLIAGSRRGHMDANRPHDLGPECNGQTGKNHNKSRNQSFRARSARRVLIAVTFDVRHRIFSQNERRPISYICRG